MRGSALLIAAAALLAGGCMTFPRSTTETVELEPLEQPVVLELHLGEVMATLSGRHDPDVSAQETGTARLRLEDLVERWEAHGLVADADFPSRRHVDATHRLRFNMATDLTLSPAWLVLSTLTAAAIPFCQDLHWSLDVEIERIADGATFRARDEDAWQRCAWLLYAPALPWSQRGAREAREATATRIAADLLAQGAFIR